MYEKIKRVFTEQYLKNQSMREEAKQQSDTFSTIIASGLQVQLLDLFCGILGISRGIAEQILKDAGEAVGYETEKKPCGLTRHGKEIFTQWYYTTNERKSQDANYR